MALPKLNDYPKHTMVQPSTGQEIRFRPFLVKEEKVMLLAAESQNLQDVLNSVVDTIVACCEGVKKETLTSFDIEYMFVKLRSKSVGESSNLTIKCQECEHGNEYNLDLNDIQMEVPELQKRVELSDSISVEMRWPQFEAIHKSIDQETGTSAAEYVFTLIRSSMAAVLTEDDRIDLSEVSIKEIDEFIESMSHDQFLKIREVVEQIPSLKHDVSFTCEGCGHENNLVVQGMENFF